MNFINLDFIWNFGTVNIMTFLTFFSFTNGIILLPASQVILIFGGLLIGKSNLSFLLIFTILVTSNFVGNYLLYFVAFNWGEKAARKALPIKKKTLDDNIIIMNYLFKKYGPQIIFFGRNLPVIHSLVSVPAGVAKVPKKIYAIYTLLGIAAWSLFFMGIGVYLDNNYSHFTKQFETIAIIVTIALLWGICLFYKNYMNHILVLAKKEK